PYQANSINLLPFLETPGYHGTVSIDPATGTVIRITIETELSGGDPLSRAATAIEYGRIQIGDSAYYCPVRSLALSTENGGSQDQNSAGGAAWNSQMVGGGGNPIVLINETRFSNYHRLGSTVRILANGGDGSSPATPDQSTATSSAPAMSNASDVPTAAVAAAAPPSAEPAPAVAGSNPPPAEPVRPAAPVVPEISMSAATGVPDQAINSTANADGGFSIKVTSRLVDVGLVAYDKKGHPVTDLKPEDLEVYDNGHKQEIRSFS